MKRQFLSFCLAAALVLPTFVIAPMTEEAQAISRYTSTSMSCGAVKSVVKNEGAVILRWSKNGHPIYGRYVASSAYCDQGARARPASVPSASGTCTVAKCKRCDWDRKGMLGLRMFDC
jgi:hypothetical protein